MTDNSRTTRRSRLAALTVAAGAALAVAASSFTTTAQWRAETTSQIGSASADSFSLYAAENDQPVRTVWNDPTIAIRNDSSRHDAWLDVEQARLTRAVSDNQTTDLRNRTRLTYRLESGLCQVSATANEFWVAKTQSQAGTDDPYLRPRAGDPLLSARLPHGTDLNLCPTLAINNQGVATDRLFLLAFAGRELNISTTLRQRSAPPATWASEPITVENTYKVGFPEIKVPSAAWQTCSRTNSRGHRGTSTSHSHGGLYWAWPFDSDYRDRYDTYETKAVDRWATLIRPRDDESARWEVWRGGITLEGGRRNTVAIDTKDLPSDGRYLVKIRAYPYANNNDVYFDSPWAQEVWRSAQPGGHWNCGNRITLTS